MTWVVDRGILRLRDQIDAAWPQRSRASDGTIGDPAHQARTSDHNPESPPPPGNPDQQVDALDITHDPVHGPDLAELTEAIRLSKDPRVKYVIYTRRIYSGSTGTQPWAWRPYSGDDPHTNHAHVSVVDNPHDQIQDWSITMTTEEQDRAARVTNAWSAGVSKTSKGEVVAPVDWRIRDEKWQASVSSALAASAARESAAIAAIQALATAGGVDAAPILARIEEVAAELGAQIGRLEHDLAATEAERDRLEQALAGAYAAAAAPAS